MDFLEIIGFSRKFKESRTNLNVYKSFKNSSDSKKTNQVILRLFQNFFLSKSPECFELFQKQANNLINFWCYRYGKVINFDDSVYKKDSQIYLKFHCTFQKKDKEPIRYVVVRKNMLYTPKISGQAKTFRSTAE